MRSLRLIRAAALSVVLAAALTISGCGKETTSTSGTSAETGISYTFTDIIPEQEYTYTLSLAEFAFEGNYIVSIADGYNMLHPDKAIKVLDTQANGYGTIKDAVKIKLMAEINEGNGPDILVLNSDQLLEFTEKGKLADLDELSPTLKAELIPAVAELGTINGTFVGLAPYIDKIYTCAVPKEYYSGTTWNLTDVLDIMDAHPELKRTFVARTTKMYNNIESRWDSLFKVYGLDWTDSGFIDYENRKADFYCEEFVRLLDRMREDSKNPYDYGAGTGLYLSLYDELNDPIEIIKLMMKDRNVFAGIPTRNRIGNRVDVRMFVAVNKDCKDPEAVMEFLKSVLYTTTSYRIPARITDISNCLQFTPDSYEKDANKLCYVTMGPFGGWSYWPIDHYDDDIIGLASKYEEFLRNLQPYESHLDIQGILTTEIKDFIENNGESDVVAERIQKRVQKYLDSLE